MNAINTIRILVTSHCNLHCRHCCQHFEKNSHILSMETLCSIADYAAEHGTDNLILSGGEYFTHPDAYKFLSYCLTKPLKVMIVSNGTLIDLNYFESVDFGDRLSVQLSIDGMEAAHDARRGLGTFERAVNCGTALSNIGIPISISMALDERNYKDAIDVLTIPFAKEVKLLPVANAGAAEDKFCDLPDEAFESTVMALLKSRSANHSPTALFPHELAISYDGSVYPSMIAQDMGVLRLGNIFERPLNIILRNTLMDNPYNLLTYTDEESPICAACPYGDECERGCRERAYKAFGSLAAPDPLCCKLFGRAYASIPIGKIFWGDTHSRIETERLVLRRWQYADVESLAKGLNDERTSLDYGTPFPYTSQDAFRFIDDSIKNQKPKFAIILKQNHELIGGCGIHQDIENASANIWIAQNQRRRGFAKEAGKALLAYGFEQLGIKEFINSCFIDNEASLGLQRSVGSIELSTDELEEVDGKRARRYLSISNGAVNGSLDQEV